MSELAPQRRARIVEQVQLTGGVRVSELTRLFGVSDMTIRRDPDTLANRGLVAKVHGGATRAGPSTEQPAFASKAVRELTEKEAIAAEAASLVRPGGAIALTAGTTAWALARHLVGVPQLTVVTNSIPVAEVLRDTQQQDQAVILTGLSQIVALCEVRTFVTGDGLGTDAQSIIANRAGELIAAGTGGRPRS